MKGHRKNHLGMYTDRQVGTKSKGSRGNGSAVERTIGRRQSSVNHVTGISTVKR